MNLPKRTDGRVKKPPQNVNKSIAANKPTPAANNLNKSGRKSKSKVKSLVVEDEDDEDMKRERQTTKKYHGPILVVKCPVEATAASFGSNNYKVPSAQDESEEEEL